jgi:hemoglobin-like flavoprotein
VIINDLNYFQDVDVSAQSKMFKETLGVCVRDLDFPERLQAKMKFLNRTHRHLNLKRHHFDAVGKALIEALEESLGEWWNPEVGEAWKIVYLEVSGIMMNNNTSH